jgi:hypothetical protein
MPGGDNDPGCYPGLISVSPPGWDDKVDAFEAMMMREEVQKGFLVSFDYTGDAESEISRFFKQTGKVIVPLTVQEILDEQIAHKLV